MESPELQLVGWHMAQQNRADLTCRTLQMAIDQRQPKPGLICHSDRGVQYAADAYQKLLCRHGLICSMSRRGDCYDNAPAESFFATLKGELPEINQYPTREQARSAIFDFIEVFYNRQRLHSALGYVAPQDRLEGRHQAIYAARDRKLEEARKQRQIRRQQAA